MPQVNLVIIQCGGTQPCHKVDTSDENKGEFYKEDDFEKAQRSSNGCNDDIHYGMCSNDPGTNSHASSSCDCDAYEH